MGKSEYGLVLGHIKELLLISLDMIMALRTRRNYLSVLTSHPRGWLGMSGEGPPPPPATAQGGRWGSGTVSQEEHRRPAHAVLQSLNDPRVKSGTPLPPPTPCPRHNLKLGHSFRETQIQQPSRLVLTPELEPHPFCETQRPLLQA